MGQKALFLEEQIPVIGPVHEPEYYDLKQSSNILNDDETQETDTA